MRKAARHCPQTRTFGALDSSIEGSSSTKMSPNESLSPAIRTMRLLLTFTTSAFTALTLMSAAAAQSSTEDVGFDAVTDPPDHDVVVVRERSYGAAGIDLTPIGIPGTHDFVQSTYVRAYHGTGSTRRVVRGRLVLPPPA